MTPVAECYDVQTPRIPRTSWTRRLLAIVPSFARSRLASLDPETLPPHLRRDLGLPDLGIGGGPDNPWLR